MLDRCAAATCGDCGLKRTHRPLLRHAFLFDFTTRWLDGWEGALVLGVEMWSAWRLNAREAGTCSLIAIYGRPKKYNFPQHDDDESPFMTCTDGHGCLYLHVHRAGAFSLAPLEHISASEHIPGGGAPRLYYLLVFTLLLLSRKRMCRKIINNCGQCERPKQWLSVPRMKSPRTA